MSEHTVQAGPKFLAVLVKGLTFSVTYKKQEDYVFSMFPIWIFVLLLPHDGIYHWLGRCMQSTWGPSTKKQHT